MKKQVLIIISVTVITCSFVACTHNSSRETISTTAVTDVNGNTHYYEPVTDENNEIVTDKNGIIVTKEKTTKNKSDNTNAIFASAENKADNVVDYEDIVDNVTTAMLKSDTTIATNTQANTSGQKLETTTTNKPTTKKTTTTSQSNTASKSTTNPTTQKQTQTQTELATDKDGWIDKWYWAEFMRR